MLLKEGFFVLAYHGSPKAWSAQSQGNRSAV